MRHFLWVVMVAVLGCQDAQGRARQAVQRAQEAGAAVYAPTELGRARAALAEADRPGTQRDVLLENALEHARAALERAQLVQAQVATRQAGLGATLDVDEGGRRAQMEEHAQQRAQVRRAPLPPDARVTPVQEAAQLVRDGKARLVDVRSAQAFERAHAGGAWRLSPLELRHVAVPPGVTLVLYGQHGDDAVLSDALEVLRQRGVTAVVLEGGLTAWQQQGRAWAGSTRETRDAPLPVLTARELAARLEKPEERTVVVDARAWEAYAAGHIVRALHISAAGKLDAPWKERPVVVTAAHQDAAEVAARGLRARGFSNVSVLEGGMEAWVTAGEKLAVQALPWSMAMGEVP